VRAWRTNGRLVGDIGSVEPSHSAPWPYSGENSMTSSRTTLHVRHSGQRKTGGTRRSSGAGGRRTGWVLWVAAALVAGSALPAAAAATAPVSPTAATGMPHLATSGTDGSVEQVRQLVQCGSTMYAVGVFTSIQRGTAVYARNNVFSFNAATGAVTSWNPDANGRVNAIALSPHCDTAYLGGTFTAVHGTTARKLAAVSTTTGAVKSGFAHQASAMVDTLVRARGRLLVGGRFTSINGSNRPYLASLDPSTGLDDGYLNLSISGTYSYTDLNGVKSAPNVTHVYNFALSPDRSKLLIMGIFTAVAGQTRQQLFMVDLTAGHASLDPWYSPDFNAFCAANHPFYVQDASWSPDMAKLFVATTGYKPATGPGSKVRDPRAGLCDAVAAYPTTAAPGQSRLWINYTGCDSLYATAADAGSVYVGGHERYASNRLGCDTYLTPGATRVSAPGMGGFNSSTGGVYTTNDPLVGRYARGRGLGADDMLLTTAGLWIASDNAQNTDGCGTTATGGLAQGHSGICFLPY
jgi:hypothetical protein